MREVWHLMLEHRGFIGEHTRTYLALREGPESDGPPLAVERDRSRGEDPWDELLGLLLEALCLTLRDDPAIGREPAVEAALQLQVAEISARARLAGCTLERLLRWCKCARRACAELALLSPLSAPQKPAAGRMLERGFDAIELALVAVWERERSALGEEQDQDSGACGLLSRKAC